MKLWQTRRHWEKFARTDPLWAVMSRVDKKGNRWEIDEFFASGQREIELVLGSVRARYPALRHGRALDFGCGVGRLSQGLAAHFHRVIGVDIAEEMIELARRYNPHPDRVEFIHHTRPDLRRLEMGEFDFLCSIITLQHIAPEYSRRYIAEFVRLLAPEGVAFFQLPTTAGLEPPERWRHSFWPPTLVKRLRRFGFRLINSVAAIDSVMEMHGISRDEVLSIITAAGGELLDCSIYPRGSPIESYAYLVRKT